MNIVESLQGALGGLGSLWLLLTQLGSDFAFIILVGIYALLVNPRGARDMGVWFSLSLFTNGVFKTALDLPRPFDVDPTVASEAAKATAGGPGLPSGHAQISATIWGMIALALRNRVFWIVASVVVVLIALSRVVLGVHFLSDVLVGLALGALFVYFLSAMPVPKPEGAWLFVVPILAIIVAVVFSEVAYASMSMGMLTGFWLSRTTFEPHKNFAVRLLGTVVGLALVFAVYFAFRVIPEDIRRLGIVEALRYMALVLMATEGVPRLLRLPRAQPRPVVS